MTIGFRKPAQVWAGLITLSFALALMAGCGGTFRRIVTPVSTPSGDPQPNKTAIFLNTNPNTGVPAGTFQGTTSLLDVSGDTLIGTRQIGFGPVNMALTINGGRVFVVDSSDSAVSYQTATATTSLLIVTSLPAGAQSNFVTSNENGKIWVTAPGLVPAKVVLINATLAAVAQVDVGGVVGCINPVGIAQQPSGKVFVACQGSNNVAVINNVNNAVLTSVPLGAAPTYAVPSTDGKYIFVAAGNSVFVIDANTATLLAPLAGVPVAGTSDYLFYDSHLQRVYAAGNGFVSVIDASGTAPTFADLKDVTTGFGGVALSGLVRVTALADGTRFYVSDPGNNQVVIFSATSFIATKAIAVGTAHPANNIPLGTASAPVSIASSSDSLKVYTANSGTHDFSVIDTVGDALVTNISAPQQNFNCDITKMNCDTQQPQQVLVTP
jgi:YVTN family beta-propeller protein